MQCAYCHQPIPDDVHPYTLRMELFPAIEPSLKVVEADLDRDFDAELQRLIQMMEKMDDAEVIEQEKRIFVRHTFTLCNGCRDRLAVQLERFKPPSE
jgi:hypothetical protein